MVKRAFAFFHTEIRGLSHAAYFLAGFSLLSQVLALFRDRIFAATLGADRILDLYYAAFRIPDFIFVIVSSLVSVSVLIPLIQTHITKGEKDSKDFLSNIFSAFFMCIGGASILAFIVAPYIIPLLFPNFKEETQELVNMTRIMLLSPILLGISNLFASVIQTKQRFVLYALCPVLYNLGIIIGVVIFYRAFGSIYALAAGVVLGALFHVAVQVPYIVSLGMFPRFRRVEWKSVWNIVRISLPRTLSLSISEVTEFVMIVIAGTLTVGSISIFSLSWNLQSVPLSIIGVSYSVALFPILSQLVKNGDRKLFLEKVSHATRHILFLGAITAAVFIVARAQIVRTIFGAGQFNWDDTRLTAAALSLFIFSLIPQCMILVFSRAFYALGNTKIPFICNLSSAAIMIIFAFFGPSFYVHHSDIRQSIETSLRVFGIQGTEVLLLPIIFSVGSLFNVLLLGWFFNKEVKGFFFSIRRALIVHTIAGCIVAITSYSFLNLSASVFDRNRLFGVLGHGFISGIAGIGAGVLFLHLIKNPELVELIESLRRSKRRPIAGPDVTM